MGGGPIFYWYIIWYLSVTCLHMVYSLITNQDKFWILLLNNMLDGIIVSEYLFLSQNLF